MSWRKKVIRNDKKLEKRITDLEISFIEKNAANIQLKKQVRFLLRDFRRMETKFYPMYDDYHNQKRLTKELEGA